MKKRLFVLLLYSVLWSCQSPTDDDSDDDIRADWPEVGTLRMCVTGGTQYRQTPITFGPGDTFRATLVLGGGKNDPIRARQVRLDVEVILSILSDSVFLYWPTWAEIPGRVTMIIPPGGKWQSDIVTFEWPAGFDAEPHWARFYAQAFWPGTNQPATGRWNEPFTWTATPS